MFLYRHDLDSIVTVFYNPWQHFLPELIVRTNFLFVSKIFSAQVWSPENPYQFQVKRFKPDAAPLMIYECHIGMAANEEKVGSYNGLS